MSNSFTFSILFLLYSIIWPPDSQGVNTPTFAKSAVHQMKCLILSGLGEEIVPKSHLGACFFFYYRKSPSCYRNVRYRPTMEGQIFGIGGLPGTPGVAWHGALNRLDFWRKAEEIIIMVHMKTWSLIFWVITVCTTHEAQRAILASINWCMSGSLVDKPEDSLMNASHQCTTMPVAEWTL